MLIRACSYGKFRLNTSKWEYCVDERYNSSAPEGANEITNDDYQAFSQEAPEGKSPSYDSTAKAMVWIDQVLPLEEATEKETAWRNDQLSIVLNRIDQYG
ncbi:hypothetical protein [Vibrio marisflavi]|uniref:Uncharacterized protein n=1 Tax=Vibrio marisflavi CECT 7928 TaxID=634439 RepID=A0ABM9A9D1_9VIBR|nr:hypothetical protein [Vibrio marisflavi]CAH0543086.1 hypothetical protein VMF7928_04393 [Vibrio marisflavi CECT 7928]